jgi:hypothetical protein
VEEDDGTIMENDDGREDDGMKLKWDLIMEDK